MSEETVEEVLDLPNAVDLLRPVRPEEILTFWLGELGQQTPFAGGIAAADTRERWFLSDESFDLEIRERFLRAWQALKVLVGSGLNTSDQPPLLRTGPGSGAATLARIIVLDQFPRNLFRGSGNMFSSDAEALTETLRGIETGVCTELKGDAEAFFYMPLMHSENRDLQRLSVERFSGLDSSGSAQFTEEFGKLVENYAKFAVDHQVIVERFGRFPHRNELLGRDSTAEELAFLQEPGSSF